MSVGWVFACSLALVVADCTLPTFGAGIVGSGSCTSGGTLPSNQSCGVTCNSNYTGTGTTTYSCGAGTNLNQTASLTCALSCWLPTMTANNDLTNGCQSGQRLNASTSCNLVCNSNYSINGNPQFSCSGAGVLTKSTATCQAVQCPYPTGNANPNVQRGPCPTSLNPGTNCTAQCATGYVPVSGSGVVTCVSRVADGPSLVCGPAPCNVSVVGASTTTDSCVNGSTLQSGESCTVKCASGYMATGSQTATCTRGTFSTTINCQPASCAFPALDMGETLGSRTPTCNPGGIMTSGSTCDLACDVGWSPTADKWFDCTMGAITTTAPYPPWCSPNPCTLPAFPPNMIANPTGPHNSTCTSASSLNSSVVCDVTCDNTTTRSLQGSFYYSCFAGNLINSPTGQCVPLNGCYMPPLGVGYSNGTCNGRPLVNGSSCSITCSNGFAGNASLSPQFTCLNGTLTPPSMTCDPAPCPVPTVGPGVTGCVSNASLPSGQSCTMGCAPGSILSVPSQNGSQYQCDHGQISQSTPFSPSTFCAVGGCTVPSTLPAGYSFTAGFQRCIAGAVLTDGSTCVARCSTGFTSGGGSTFRCTNGTLAPEFNCTASDCVYTVPFNTPGWVGFSAGPCNQSCSLTFGNQPLASGKCCDYACLPGYSYAGGSMEYACQVPPPSCPFQCSATPAAADLVCTPNPCLLPLNLGAGVDNGTCTPNGTLTGSGTGNTCDVTCASTHYLSSGTTTYSCSLGNLTAATAVCLPRNCSLPASFSSQQFVGVDNGPNNNNCSVNEVLTSGTGCDVGCAVNFTSNGGSSVYSCQFGQFTSTPSLVCTAPADCALPTNFDPSMTPGAPTPCSTPGFLSNGTLCGMRCKSGYTASSGNSTYSCLNGTLTAPTAMCLANNCTVTLGANETGGNCTTLLSGTSCVSGCAIGYTQKAITRTCDLGNLTTTGGTCSPAQCQLPLAFAEGLRGIGGGGGCVENSQLASGTSCSVTCGNGYVYLNGTGTQYSCSFGNLTATPGISCQPASCPVSATTGLTGDNSTGKACIPGQNVAHGDYCLWTCDSANGYQGGSAYQADCSYGSLSTPTTTCTDRYPCVLPAFGPNVVSSTCGPPGSTLNFNSRCDVVCDTTGLYTRVDTTSGIRFRFSCDVAGQFNPPYTFQCIPLPCSLPYDFGVGTLNGTCVPATRLDSGSSCAVACASGSSMSPANALSYTCEAGILTSPGTCIQPAQCAVPAFTNSHYAGASLADVFACSESQALSSGSSCNVGCAPSFTPDSGTTAFSCNAGALTSPTLICTGPPCTLPNLESNGFASAQCSTGGSLAYGTSCTVSCAAPAYNASNMGSTQYVCGSTLTRPTLRCAAQQCVLPSTLPASIVFSGGCRTGGNLAPGSNCGVTCASSYSTNGTGTRSYSCAAGTPFGSAPVLTDPTFVCTPNLCSLPSPMIAGYVATSCPPNSAASNCNVQCAQGFNSVKNGVVGPVVASCPVNGGNFVFSGCNADLPCNVNPKTGYTITCASPSTPGNCTGTVCATGYYGTPVLGCSAAGNPMTFTGCAACRTTCPAGLGSTPCNTTSQSPCTNCSVNTYNNGSMLDCAPCPASKCSGPGASVCVDCPPQQVSVGEGDSPISDGALAAAIIVPLLVVALIVLVVWNHYRKKAPKGSAAIAKSEKAHNDTEMGTAAPPLPATDPTQQTSSRKETTPVEMERGPDGLWRQKSQA